MNRRMKIMEAYANLRALLMQEIHAREDVGYPDNLDEAIWALKDSESWYHWTPGADATPHNLERRVDAYLDANLPDEVRKDAERWAVVKSRASCGTWKSGFHYWSIGALPSDSECVTVAIDAEIKRRSERKDGET